LIPPIKETSRDSTKRFGSIRRVVLLMIKKIFGRRRALEKK
jgi:hypothetical protein